MMRTDNDWCVRARRGRAARQDAAIKFSAPERPETFVRWALTPKAQALLDSYASDNGAYPLERAR
jgi:hypothetical protein